MIIRSVALRTPSQCLTNEDILQRIREYNVRAPSDDVLRYCRKIGAMFENVGAETRYIRDRKGGEKGFDLIMDAMRAALEEASMTAAKIDLVIFCGVGRGFLEPANAAFIAKALGGTCQAFDISEACMSWVRALQVANGFLAAMSYSNILVVNAEFGVHEHGLPGILGIRSDAHLEFSFPSLTIGEGVSATVLSRSENRWNFKFKSIPKYASLCNLPLDGFEDYCEPDPRIGANGNHQLAAYGQRLGLVAIREMIAFVRQNYQNATNIAAVDAWLPHNPGEAGLALMATRLGLGSKLHTGIFRKFGNLVSASIPAALYTATRDGRLKRGDRIVFCPASAGMSFGLVEGVY
ncbi:3-oxoacyl-[acyl-carrier-protein] synthase III C-terminal domain-containing protein [Tardiphaga sp. OK245]|uniref:3-oxoacyl-[acyl-carrier-protein] synthase III C-terminal domain-containing protein n=1 Tax=Tardiphaga sp. OK245 TaxID=1855306 RepID=UPI0008A7D3C4|nr:3-oxoacyl-[acyl-carrier-protein] synthase III C-terminal domain-containing protein [Tardiphaga sp. OK245]SEI17691.1 3-oxoacyl-[acyl-carrier-protein] synthase III [Tardiphaga sp. OK245]